jgi:hypothetical protein
MAEDGWASRYLFCVQFSVIDEKWRAFGSRRPDCPLWLSHRGGELSLDYSPDYVMRDRVRRTIEIGHASRVGPA